MHFFYNIGILFFGFGIRIASLFNPKAKEWLNGRKNYFQNLPKIEKDNVIWFHCASLGEFDQGIPLMKIIKKNAPKSTILVTFFSPSGMKFYTKREAVADIVTYLPLDTLSNAKKFINHFKPQKAFFIKYEFWGNHILEASKANTELYNVSGIFRKKQRFFRWYGGFFRTILKKFKWFYVQTSESKELLNSIGIKNISITGDSRYDKVIENKDNVVKDSVLDSFKGEDSIFIIGSSWPDDEKILLPVINEISDRVIIAPHNIDENHIKGITSKLTRPHERFTHVDQKVKNDTEVLVLDTIGQLSNAYSYGNYSYVGGGFSGSLHNILEPAVFGLPVIFGPKHRKFPEGNLFIKGGFGFSVSSKKELETSIRWIKEKADEIRKKEVEFIKSNAGTSLKIYEHINSN